MIRGCTDRDFRATGMPDHLLFDHYLAFYLCLAPTETRHLASLA